jgi:hypothetical protein
MPPVEIMPQRTTNGVPGMDAAAVMDVEDRLGSPLEAVTDSTSYVHSSLSADPSAGQAGRGRRW